jgi:hypothetical protein
MPLWFDPGGVFHPYQREQVVFFLSAYPYFMQKGATFKILLISCFYVIELAEKKIRLISKKYILFWMHPKRLIPLVVLECLDGVFL